MRRRGPDEGAAALETALVAPLFIILVLATLNVGWALYCGAEVRHAVERSTRLLLEDPETTGEVILDAVQAQLAAADPEAVDLTLTIEKIGFDADADPEDTDYREVAKLAWTYEYTIDAPFIQAVTIPFDSSLIVPLRAS